MAWTNTEIRVNDTVEVVSLVERSTFFRFIVDESRDVGATFLSQKLAAVFVSAQKDDVTSEDLEKYQMLRTAFHEAIVHRGAML